LTADLEKKKKKKGIWWELVFADVSFGLAMALSLSCLLEISRMEIKPFGASSGRAIWVALDGA
jgi:hypothetical protein